MTSVAALLVTHDSERWIERTLRSVMDQSQPPDAVVVIDDESTDGTVALVEKALGSQVVVLAAVGESTDRPTRIAANFQQGIRECLAHDIVVLGDHDDVWHPDRIRHQAGLLEARSDMSLVASDGRLVDEEGRPIGGTLRGTFPVLPGFDGLPASERIRYALRHSVATGGASALRPQEFVDVPVPPGWLHDRWWSLVATVREQMLVDDDVVIDYRLSDTQEVGLDLGLQDQHVVARFVIGVAQAGSTLNRVQDIRRELSQYATQAMLPDVTGTRLMRNLM